MRSSVERIRDYYDRNAESELKRLPARSLEFEVARRFLDKFLPKRASVLDVGAGPSRHSIHLARQRYSVTVLDISSECVRLAANEGGNNG
jgi:2-polyprenyl-3-methyl-5-hydroxy-6-metoxy-1,4-benzoquinol methylase